MKADIGRMTFDPAKNFARVVLQQGRVQVESDWNEQVAILLDAVRTLAADVIGPWGGSPGAFRVDADPAVRSDVSIGAGHYYVEGVRIETDGARYTTQPHYPLPDGQGLTPDDEYLLYVDVWERLVTAAEDPSLADVALGGLDTAARTQPVWQVRARRMPPPSVLGGITCEAMTARWPGLRAALLPAARGRMQARARVSAEELDQPCAIDPRLGYRSDENALFRVEIHRDGRSGPPSIKWSRDNGSVAMPISSFTGDRVHVTTLGRDPRLTLDVGDKVELEWDSAVLQHHVAPMLEVSEVDPTGLTVTLTPAPTPVPADQHPRLRRWDQKGTRARPLADDGTVDLVEDDWTELSHGVSVRFVPTPGTAYRTGDFWLVPARTATGDVVWPQDTGPGGGTTPVALGPQGVEHRYAPLARIAVGPDGVVTVLARYVRELAPAATCPP